MIANPALEAFRYNPYDKSLTREHYETQKMLQLRRWVRRRMGFAFVQRARMHTIIHASAAGIDDAVARPTVCLSIYLHNQNR